MTTNKPVKQIPRKRKPKSKRRIFLTIILIIVMLGLLGCLAVGGYVLSLAADLPDISAEELVNAQTTFVYDAEGGELAQLHGGENRVTVSLSEMPQYLIDAVLASEDIRFYDHHGVDWRSVMRAIVVDVVDTIKAGEVTFTQGASTITMQLVRNVIDERETTLNRKIKEALLAVQFEKSYDKDVILYYYLNEIYIGPQIYGMQAASEYYFGKDVSDISLSEAALLVAILRNPGYYSPYSYPDRVLNVRNTVLSLMTTYDAEKYAVTAETAKSDPLVVYEGSGDDANYEHPWFVDNVISEGIDILVSLGMEGPGFFTKGLRVYTTLDRNVQTAMETVYADDNNFPDSNTGDIVESGMAIVEPSTGQIKGLIGGRVYETRRGFNRATMLERSPGSTIKPLVSYGPAVELGYGAGTVINDSPLTYGSWSPNNDDRQFQGRITMRKAIMASRNVCAVKMLMTIGVETGYSYGLKLGLPLVESDAVPALTLGGLTYGVSPLEMISAFATFANEGLYIEPYSITRITTADGEVLYSAVPEAREVFTAQTAYIMTDMLMSAVNGGTGTAAKISGWQTAGKTGTNGLPSAKDDPDYAGKSGTKDAWFCGYTPVLAGAVWMGYDDKKDTDGNLQYLSNVYGGTYPARLFKAVMTQALQNYQVINFTRPDGVGSMSVDTKTGTSPTALTPDEFRSADLFGPNGHLEGDGTVWQMAEICADTGLLANTYCPNKVSKVVLSYPEDQPPSEKVADYYLYKPATTCNTHATSQGNLVSVYICTHSSHHGQSYLANIPGSGSSGGCPEEYLEVRYYSASSLPSQYCDIADHQVVGTAVQQGKGNSGTGSWWGDFISGEDEVPVLNTPQNLIATRTDNGIELSWSANNDSSVVYILSRTQDDKKERYMVYGTAYVDSQVRSDRTYTYRVYAYHADSETTSGWSNEVSVDY
jgi:penicillin-binding protein 1A